MVRVQVCSGPGRSCNAARSSRRACRMSMHASRPQTLVTQQVPLKQHPGSSQPARITLNQRTRCQRGTQQAKSVLQAITVRILQMRRMSSRPPIQIQSGATPAPLKTLTWPARLRPATKCPSPSVGQTSGAHATGGNSTLPSPCSSMLAFLNASAASSPLRSPSPLR